MNATRFVTILALFWNLTTLTGCAALVAGGAAAGGAFVYVSGWLERDYEVSLKPAVDAVLTATDDLNLTVEEKTVNLADASVKAKNNDTDVWIRLESEDRDVTTISVRVGVLGDEEASKRIHEAIAKRI